MTNELLLIAWSAIAAAFLLRLTFIHCRFNKQIFLLRDVDLAQPIPWPRVSLIVPACDEEAAIGGALESLLRMDYPNLELIVINDRSKDGTQAVLEKLQNRNSTIKIVQVQVLPPGWLGKVHALEQGRQVSSGEWLLFSDADVHYGPKSLKKAISYAAKLDLDYLTVTPAMQASGFLLRACIIQFTKVLAWSLDFKRIADPSDRQALGIGAFNLVKRKAFEASRGFAWLRLEVIDDTGLASMMKEEGARLGVVGGLDEIELEWYPSFWSFVRGLEKNAFAVFQYSYFAVAMNALFVWFVFFGIFFAPIASGSRVAIATMASCLAVYLLSAYRALKKLIPFSLTALLIAPLVQALFPLIAIRATVLFLLNGGIWWRGTFYAKADLIANQRLKLLDQFSNRKFPKTKHPSNLSE